MPPRRFSTRATAAAAEAEQALAFDEQLDLSLDAALSDYLELR